MIKLRKLKITNYHSCINTTVDLNNGLTALIGVNGSGKSSILMSLRLLNKFLGTPRYAHRDTNNAIAKTTIHLDLSSQDKEIFVKIVFYYNGEERDIDEISFARFFYKEARREKWSEIDPYYQLIREQDKNNQKFLYRNPTPKQRSNIGELVHYLTNISYYGPTQFSDPEKCPAAIELDDSEKSARLSRYRFDRAHDKFIHDLYITYRDKKDDFKRYLNLINNKGIGLISGISFRKHELSNNSYEVKSAGKIKKISRIKTLIIPSFKIDNLWLSPNQLSEGTFKTLALIFYILNDESDLLLIEEPEVCVHHGLLNSIIELIKLFSKKKQIVISTHSDFVLDDLSPEDILLVTRSQQVGTIAKKLTKSLTKNQYSALRRYLNESGNLGEYWKEIGFSNE